MRRHISNNPAIRSGLMALICGLIAACTVQAQTADSGSQPKPEPKPWLDIYGFANLDMGYDFKQVNPDWYDVVRPTKLPAYTDEYGSNGNFYMSVRQTRFGARSEVPTKLGPLKSDFEFELFGTGVDAGQTTFRLRQAYGELGQFLGGQTWSTFMDPDIFPNTVEYWGPNGMVLFRNVQFRWMPIRRGKSHLWFALERPGASADQGQYADRIELENVKAHFPLPDFTAQARLGRDWGHVQIAGIGRRIEWVDTGTGPYNLSGGTWGWGVNVTSVVNVAKKDALKLGIVYGKGIQNYMNDAPEDIGPAPNPGNSVTPVIGQPIPLVAFSAYYDRYWSEKWSSSFGYSRLDTDNTEGQSAVAFRTGQYASANLLCYPVKNMMAGTEFIYGYRKNFRDGFSVPDYRVQVTFRYNFSFRIGGN
jgi:hypothetical protein